MRGVVLLSVLLATFDYFQRIIHFWAESEFLENVQILDWKNNQYVGKHVT